MSCVDAPKPDMPLRFSNIAKTEQFHIGREVTERNSIDVDAVRSPFIV